MTREEALAESVKELGKQLAWLTDGGKFNSKIKLALERARAALRMGKHES